MPTSLRGEHFTRVGVECVGNPSIVRKKRQRLGRPWQSWEKTQEALQNLSLKILEKAIESEDLEAVDFFPIWQDRRVGSKRQHTRSYESQKIVFCGFGPHFIRNRHWTLSWFVSVQTPILAIVCRHDLTKYSWNSWGCWWSCNGFHLRQMQWEPQPFTSWKIWIDSRNPRFLIKK